MGVMSLHANTVRWTNFLQLLHHAADDGDALAKDSRWNYSIYEIKYSATTVDVYGPQWRPLPNREGESLPM